MYSFKGQDFSMKFSKMNLTDQSDGSDDAESSPSSPSSSNSNSSAGPSHCYNSGFNSSSVPLLHTSKHFFDIRSARGSKMSSFLRGDPVHRSAGVESNTVERRVWGIDVDVRTGKMYVVDKMTNQVRIFSPYGVQLAEFGNGVLLQPTGVAVDHTNNRIIVSSSQNNLICIFTLDGRFIYSFGRLGARVGQFNCPWGVAISPTGDMIVVADSMNHRLQTFDKFGNFLNSYSVFEVDPYQFKAEFDYPRAVCFDQSGHNIYAADFNINAIFKFNLNLSQKTVFVPPGRLMRPQGLTLDDSGNMYVCDSGHGVVRTVSPSGSLLANIRGDISTNSPNDLTILPNDQLAIIDKSGVVRIY